MNEQDFAAERAVMVEYQLRRRGITDSRVLQAFLDVPRHLFVPPSHRDMAYADRPLPIGEGQTISQPYMVARMTEALNLTGSERALEVGTGSGYQAAILAKLCREVISIERHQVLSERAGLVLSELGITNVRLVVGDGSLGFPEAAPYDVIVVTAAAPRIPPALIEQLVDGGRMVIPVGPPAAQSLILARKTPEALVTEDLGGCVFVPLISDAEQPDD
ncbi:MAG: protein-L-isoaspartate(D-aspartate) O-methyltransferase [Armatimonadota bacterium]